jgi:TetR/AcrR family fatty acid metabolism transcriptional regulator
MKERREGRGCRCKGGFLEKYQRGKYEDRRNHILDAAFDLFIKKGVMNIKMEDIAHAAGYGKSTLYEYFDSKDAIFAELLNLKMTVPWHAIGDSIDPAAPPIDKIRTFLSAEMDLVLEYNGKENLLSTIMLHPENVVGPLLMKTAKGIILYKFNTLAGYIREGIETGVFREMDPYLSASALIGASQSFIATITSPDYAKIADSDPSDPKYREALFDFVFRALA